MERAPVRLDNNTLSALPASARSYPGGKAGAGVYQRIICQMPPHHVYIEPFLGGGAVMRAKLPAFVNVGIDLDPAPIAAMAAALAGVIAASDGARAWQLLVCDAISYLQNLTCCGDELIYCDPPYLLSTRQYRRRYRCELDDEQHSALLDILLRLPCRVMVSGYASELYEERLRTWRLITFEAMTRSGRTATEHLWCNFPEPVELHDYRYLGCGFRERERIRRKIQRWSTRLARMDLLERRALLAALARADIGDPAMPAAAAHNDGIDAPIDSCRHAPALKAMVPG